MSKIGFYLLGLFSGIVLPSLYAWKQVDEANMAKPEVRVIKEYVGAFRGWDESCLNCKQKAADKSVTLLNASKSIAAEGRVQREAYRMGYCECNCQQETTR